MQPLEWGDARDVELEVVGEERLTLDLGVPADRMEAFQATLASLREYLISGGFHQEFRLDLPKGWRVFFKGRPDSESRLLVARPTAEEWVGTVALSVEACEAWLGALKASEREPTGGLPVDESLSVWIRAQGGVAGRVWKMSNFDLRIRRLPG
jgi:hypothetical protein